MYFYQVSYGYGVSRPGTKAEDREPNLSRADIFIYLLRFVVVVVVVVLLFYVHGKHLRSCRDGQLT